MYLIVDKFNGERFVYGIRQNLVESLENILKKENKE